MCYVDQQRAIFNKEKRSFTNSRVFTMRSFMAYLAHETNSFSPIATNLASFEECGIYRPSMGSPEQHLPLLKGVADFYRLAKQQHHDAIVGTCALAQPSAPCDQQHYQQLRDEILQQLKAAKPVDMVLLMMHGAMMAQACDDCEGDLLRRVRSIVGPNVAIGLLLDLHCNLTADMFANTDIIIPCKEYPHTDFAARAQEVYQLTTKVAKGEIKPVHSFYKVPVLGLFQTLHSPMKDFIQQMIQAESKQDILSVGLAHGFPWADFPDAGAGVIVTTNNQPDLGSSTAQHLGKAFFNIRAQAQAHTESLEQLMLQVSKPISGTTVIADMADNPGGGAASESTFVLQAFLNANIDSALFGLFWDPYNVELAFAKGEGTSVEMSIGGKVSDFSGPPVTLTVRIRHLRCNAQQPHIADGYPVLLGATAVVEACGIILVLNTIRQQPFHPQAFLSAGVDPWEMQFVVVKSSHHFYAGFGKRATKIIYVDTPGTLSADASQRPYTRLKRPVWPLDTIEL